MDISLPLPLFVNLRGLTNHRDNAQKSEQRKLFYLSKDFERVEEKEMPITIHIFFKICLIILVSPPTPAANPTQLFTAVIYGFL